jgi:hypothetical protein
MDRQCCSPAASGSGVKRVAAPWSWRRSPSARSASRWYSTTTVQFTANGYHVVAGLRAAACATKSESRHDVGRSYRTAAGCLVIDRPIQGRFTFALASRCSGPCCPSSWSRTLLRARAIEAMSRSNHNGQSATCTCFGQQRSSGRTGAARSGRLGPRAAFARPWRGDSSGSNPGANKALVTLHGTTCGGRK